MKKRYKKAIAIVVASYVLILLLTHILVKLPLCNEYFNQITWDGGDILGFTAEFLSAAAAFFFGWAVYRQTNKHHEDEEIKDKANTARPFLIIDCVEIKHSKEEPGQYERSNPKLLALTSVEGAYDYFDNKNAFICCISFKNVGEGVCLNFRCKRMVADNVQPPDAYQPSPLTPKFVPDRILITAQSLIPWEFQNKFNNILSGESNPKSNLTGMSF